MYIIYPIIAGTLTFISAIFITEHFELYYKYPELDILFHFLGGLIAAWFFVIYYKKTFDALPRLTSFLFILALASLVGVVWEFAEYISHMYAPLYIWKYFHIGDLHDTIKDFANDILGGLVIAVLYLIKRKN